MTHCRKRCRARECAIVSIPFEFANGVSAVFVQINGGTIINIYIYNIYYKSACAAVYYCV